MYKVQYLIMSVITVKAVADIFLKTEIANFLLCSKPSTLSVILSGPFRNNIHIEANQLSHPSSNFARENLICKILKKGTTFSSVVGENIRGRSLVRVERWPQPS